MICIQAEIATKFLQISRNDKKRGNDNKKGNDFKI